jgi:hypothetical protein
MNLTKEKLLCLWNNREQIFKDKKNAEVITRFDAIKAFFDEVDNITITKNDGKYSIDNKEIKYADNTYPSPDYFGCDSDGISAEGAFNGVQNMLDKFPEDYHDLIKKVGCILGGFDFENNKYMSPDYRIISNKIKDNNDNGSLVSSGQYRHPSSNFADNNFFYVIIHTLKQIKENSFKCEESDVVLRWPGFVGENNTYYYRLSIDEIKTAQQETLKHRFPYKFFYMWTHRDSCIHLLSLMPYQELARCGDDCKHQDSGIDMNFETFADEGNEKGWKKYSDKIASYIEPDATKRDAIFMSDLSKLISIIAINEDQSIRNTEELLRTGNQAIILWGPPGTSKTFSAEMLVKSMLETESLEDVKFPNQNEKGCYELVQFHPNYAYEDFIGGIAPQVTGNTLAYTLKEGVFKKFCDEANREGNEVKKFIFIIDEINRADLSSVFGELLYALEKRGQGVSIPNFTENEYKFVIPQNVYLIGTMNNVDKSLVSFDLALRRRFSFVRMMPDLSVLNTMLTDYSVSKDVTNSVEDENLVAYIERCEYLNNRISTSQNFGLNENYQIGQAYFMKIKDFLPVVGNKEYVRITPLELEKLWEYHLLPLIEEYLGARADEKDIKDELKVRKSEFIQAL